MTFISENLKHPGFDLEEIRKDFAYLNMAGDPIIYFDNAATTQRPEQVIQRMTDFYRHDNGNPLRGAHRLGNLATEAMIGSRARVAGFIHAKPEEIIFTRNATEALNLVSYAWALNRLRPDDEILITRMEHHSNCVNWQFVTQQTGAKLIYVDLNADYSLNMADFESKLSEKTKILAFTAASNVLGTLTPAKQMIAAAKAAGALTVLDGAQYVPHFKTDVRDLDCDFLAFSGHKMLGPFGIGVLYGKEKILKEMRPFLFGGEMIEYVEDDQSTFTVLPYKFEAGTQDVGGMVGLAAAIDYLEKIGLDNIAAYEDALTEYALQQMQALPYIDLYHADHLTSAPVAPVIAFNVKDAHPHDVATILDYYGVAVRAGHHCTQPLHRYIGQYSTNRASFAFYNTKAEVDQFIRALGKVREIMHLDEE